MTTGCNCGTAGCAGIAPAPGARCPRCEIAAMPPGPVRQLIRAALKERQHAATGGHHVPAGHRPGSGGTQKGT